MNNQRKLDQVWFYVFLGTLFLCLRTTALAQEQAPDGQDQAILQQVPKLLFSIPDPLSMQKDKQQPLTQPLSVAVDEATGNIYVSDIANVVKVFSSSGAYLGYFGEPGSAPGCFNIPVSLFIDQGKKLLFVLDQKNYRVEIYQLANIQLKAGIPPAGVRFKTVTGDTTAQEDDGDLTAIPVKIVPLPEGTVPQLGEQALLKRRGADVRALSTEVVSDSFGKIIVLEGGSHRVLIYNAEGEYLTKYGEAGHGPDRLYFPEGLALTQVKYVDNKGRTRDRIQHYIADTMNRRAKVVTEKGEFLLAIGGENGKQAEFSMPTGVAVDNQERIYVLDRMTGECSIFDKEGNFILAFGQEGDLYEKLYSPSRLVVSDKLGRIYISDMGNNRVMIYQMAPKSN